MRWTPLALCMLAVVPGSLAAQSNPVVRAAVGLAAEGRGDSAYRLVSAELSRATPGDSGYVEALFWRARLAIYGDSAERDLRRVAIEYASSPWADDALLQLSQLALAAGNPASAFELAGRVRSDYPGSDLKPGAALWAARAAFQIGEPRSACALLDSAASEGAADVEFANQVQFFRGRCTAALLAAPPPRRAEGMATTTLGGSTRDTATSRPAAAPPAGARYEVQVAAAASDEAARNLVDRLARAGLAARIVPGAGNVRRVRLGPFPSQAAADSVARAAQRVAGGAPFLVRVP